MTIEIYIGDSDKHIVALHNQICVPPKDALISILGVTYTVLDITWAIDYASDSTRKELRANITCKLVGE